MFVEYSLIWIIPIIILAFFGSIVLYYYPKTKNIYTSKQRLLLSILRFSSLLLILFLLLSPVLKYKKNVFQKPIIILAQDNSSSISLNKDSIFYKTNYLKALDGIVNDFKESYDVKIISFGDSVREVGSIDNINYRDNATDISSLLQEIEDRYSNLNLSSIILSSDGIINKGENPLNKVQDLQVPIFTIALGDTTIKKDIFISETRYNRIAYLNNKFPLEFVVLANKSKGLTSNVKVIKDGKTIFEERFNIDDNSFSKSFNTILTADKVGLQHYKIIVQEIDKEQTIVNNSQDIFIEVLDGRQKVLLLASFPHPDLSAIKQSIESNENYEVHSLLFADFPSSLKEYSIAILHQIPASIPNHLQAIKKIREANIPILFVIGAENNLSYYNTLSTGLQITNNKSSQNSALALFNSNFTLFSISKETEDMLNKFPPLQVPFSSYSLSAMTQSLFNQKIGSTATNYPLIFFSNNPALRTGTIVGEGFWRWRLQNYLINQTHTQADEIIHKSIQYLSVKENKSQFRVICNKVFAENQSISMDAELYNDSYELINQPDVKLIVTNEEKTTYSFVFSKTSNAYHINIGSLPSGKYSYKAFTSYGGKNFSQEGIFFVAFQNIEAINLIADHNLLYNISHKTSAQFVYPNEISKLKELIKQRKDHKPLIIETLITKRFIDLWWYLTIILIFIVLEWFLRKYWGKI